MKDYPNDKLYSDAKFRRDKARVKRLVKKWIKPLGLDRWQTIRVEYSREPLSNENPQNTTVAECRVFWEYLKGVLTFNMLEVEDVDDGELEYRILHELCHFLVAEMSGPETDRKREERVVTNLAMAFMDVEVMGICQAKARKRKKK